MLSVHAILLLQQKPKLGSSKPATGPHAAVARQSRIRPRIKQFVHPGIQGNQHRCYFVVNTIKHTQIFWAKFFGIFLGGGKIFGETYAKFLGIQLLCC